MDAVVEVVDTNCRRICAIRIVSDSFRLLLINVYMPFEGNDSMTDDFVDQLQIISNIISNNLDCHIIGGGGFNVDLSRTRVHTAMLNSFCSNIGLNFAICHDKCKTDFSYSFNSSRFNVLDHFLLSGTLFTKSVGRVSVLHDVDNMSDHEPIVLDLSLNVNCVGFKSRIYTASVSWVKATDNNVREYQATLTLKLSNIDTPTDVLLCKDTNCTNLNYLLRLNRYVADITDHRTSFINVGS
jgi:hypothetical protein